MRLFSCLVPLLYAWCTERVSITSTIIYYSVGINWKNEDIWNPTMSSHICRRWRPSYAEIGVPFRIDQIVVFVIHEISEIRGSPRSSVLPEDEPEVARSLAIDCSLSDEEISRSNNYLQNILAARRSRKLAIQTSAKTQLLSAILLQPYRSLGRRSASHQSPVSQP